LNPKPDLAFVQTALENVKRAIPEFADMRIVHAWGGAIDTMPDLIPVISDVAKIPGFFIASGFSGHGFGLGPAAGELLADLVTGSPTTLAVAPYRLDRFSDGTILKVPEMM
jgi:glycine/D-amino acid oxidase-like deaminating enzyme